MNLEKCKKKIMRFKYLLNTSHILISERLRKSGQIELSIVYSASSFNLYKRSIAWCLRSVCKIGADLLPCMKNNARSLPHPVLQSKGKLILHSLKSNCDEEDESIVVFEANANIPPAKHAKCSILKSGKILTTPDR
uniref:CSON015576 protein n=1 Tax=Culicoides sonorensis TaxID=179676 RepID=A0A336MHG7_CULSO